MDFETMGMVMDLVNRNMEEIGKDDMFVFIPFICMLLEEYCKAKGEDVAKVTEMINTAVKQVNEEEGRY